MNTHQRTAPALTGMLLVALIRLGVVAAEPPAPEPPDWVVYPAVPNYGEYVGPPYEVNGHVVRGGS